MTKHETRRRGWTLLELSVSAAVLGTIISGALWVTTAVRSFLSDAELQHMVDLSGQQALRRIKEELREADLSTILPLVLKDSNWIEYRKPLLVPGAEPTLDGHSRISLAPAPGESLDGLDNNADGRIDEQRILLRNGTGTAVPIVGNVSDLRMSFGTSGKAIEVEVDISVPDRGDSPTPTIFRTVISPRNRR